MPVREKKWNPSVKGKGMKNALKFLAANEGEIEHLATEEGEIKMFLHGKCNGLGSEKDRGKRRKVEGMVNRHCAGADLIGESEG